MYRLEIVIKYLSEGLGYFVNEIRYENAKMKNRKFSYFVYFIPKLKLFCYSFDYLYKSFRKLLSKDLFLFTPKANNFYVFFV